MGNADGWRPEHDPDALSSPRPVEVVAEQDESDGVEQPQEAPPS
jgi:hypothetical protein